MKCCFIRVIKVLHFSSEDELDFTIHCATQKGLRVRHSSVSSKGSSAESDFEKEMNEELNQRVSALEEARKSGQISKGRNTVLSALVNHENIKIYMGFFCWGGVH